MSPTRADDPPPTGTLLVVCAPSGAGKTSLVRGLIEAHGDVDVSVSHTTREPRDGERDGFDYHFVDEEQFEGMVRAGELLEHALVFGHRYGTARRPVQARLAAGRDVVLEIDWQGARQVRGHMPDAVSVFILPPSRAALEKRLRARGRDSGEIIERRMAEAVTEMTHWDEFDYLVVNERFDDALGDLRAVLAALRLRREGQGRRHAELIDALLA